MCTRVYTRLHQHKLFEETLFKRLLCHLYWTLPISKDSLTGTVGLLLLGWTEVGTTGYRHFSQVDNLILSLMPQCSAASCDLDAKWSKKQSHYRPWQSLRVAGVWGSQIPKQSAHEGGKVVSPTPRPLYLEEIFLVLISVKDWVKPRAIVRPEGLCQLKIPVRPPGIEPATFRFVAQFLNHFATACKVVSDYWCQNGIVMWTRHSSLTWYQRHDEWV
jgi:hypothetical protein